MTKITKTLLIASLTAALVGGGLWWNRSSISNSLSSQPAGAPAAGAKSTGGQPVVVTLYTALRQDVPITIEVNGSVASLNSVEVRPQISNMVKQVHVKEGQFVRAGELLFTLDDRADRANLDKALAQQLRDQAMLADLERQYRRSLDLVAQNFIAKSAADTTLSQVEAQRALVASDAAAIQSARVALTFDALSSPIAGRIGAINVFAGSLAQPTTVLVTVTQLNPIAVSFPVPEGSLQDVLLAVKNRAGVMATVQGTTTPLQGVFSFVDNTVDASVGTVRVKAVFDNQRQQLWPGQYVGVQATVRTLKDATVIPLASVITNTTGQVVYVVSPDTADQTVQLRKITVMQVFGERAAVTGLQPGEKIVLDGKQNLRPGGRVRIESNGAGGNADKRSNSKPDQKVEQKSEPQASQKVQP